MKTTNYKDHLHIVFAQDHYNPLGVIRSLGECGISPVVVLCTEGNPPYLVNHSKYIGKIHIVEKFEDGIKLIKNLYSNEVLKPFIYSCSDDIESTLDAHYDDLVDYFYFFNGGEKGRLGFLMQKSEIMNLAVESGLRIPQTEIVRVGDLPQKLNYPILTKSTISTVNKSKSNTFICRNEEELIKAYEKITESHIILQEYIDKVNELCIDGICIHGKGIYIPIQSEYIRFNPSAYGNYILFKQFEDTQIFKQMEVLFDKTRFTGIFSIEFLRDKNNNLYFLEINFRNSTWSYAHTKMGVNLPIIYAKSILADNFVIDDVKVKKIPFTAIQEFSDFKDGVLGKQVSLWQWIKDVMNCDCLFYYNKYDPNPFWSALRKKIVKF